MDDARQAMERAATCLILAAAFDKDNASHYEKAAADLRAALAARQEQPAQPVAWRVNGETDGLPWTYFEQKPKWHAANGFEVEPLFTRPQPAQASTAPSDGWRPIETAPKETPVWLVSKDGSIWIGEHCYEGDGWLWGNCYMSVYQRADDSWGRSDCNVDDDYQPTHWMPLPAPLPQENTAGSTAPALRERCNLALACLPDAEYRTRLARLFDDLLAAAKLMHDEIARLNATLDSIADLAREGQTPDATLLSFAEPAYDAALMERLDMVLWNVREFAKLHHGEQHSIAIQAGEALDALRAHCRAPYVAGVASTPAPTVMDVTLAELREAIDKFDAPEFAIYRAECSHDSKTTTIGPTTDQRNHHCPDCGKLWTIWPTDEERRAVVPVVVAPSLTDKQIADGCEAFMHAALGGGGTAGGAAAFRAEPKPATKESGGSMTQQTTDTTETSLPVAQVPGCVPVVLLADAVLKDEPKPADCVKTSQAPSYEALLKLIQTARDCSHDADAQLIGLMEGTGISESRPVGQQLDLLVAWARKCMTAWTAGVRAFAKGSWQHAVDDELVNYGKTSHEFATPHEAMKWLMSVQWDAALAAHGADSVAGARRRCTCKASEGEGCASCAGNRENNDGR
jgi:hypothetical protein